MAINSVRAIVAATAFGFAAWALLPAASFAEEPSGESAQIPCLCLYAGMSYEQAECACLPTPNGPRLACCGKVLNNSSWMFMGDACSLSQSRPEGSGGVSRAVRGAGTAEAAPQVARRASEPR